MSLSKISFSLSSLNNEYQNNGLQPTTLVDLVLQRIENCTTPNIWIFQAPASDLQARAQTLMSLSDDVRNSLPLFGIPFALKDNIDVQGYPTTAGCPDFEFVAKESATLVKKLEEAGGIFIGKTLLEKNYAYKP